MKQNGIVVFGAVFVDIKGYPMAQFIPAGRNVGRVEQVHGGVARNVVEDVANAGLHPTFVSVLDESGVSTDVLEKLNRRQVNTQYIRRVQGGLGSWLAVFDNQGDVVASISQRPDLSAIGEILDETGSVIFEEADSIVVEIDMDPSLLIKIFDLAEHYGKEVYAVVSNMSIAMERRDLLKRTGCIVCNLQEAGLLFSDNYEEMEIGQIQKILERRVTHAQISRMVVTMGERGAIYIENGKEREGESTTSQTVSGWCPAPKVNVVDTTGAGDSFFAGVAIGLTYGKSLKDACVIGTRLASSVIATKENVCPLFLPEELDLTV